NTNRPQKLIHTVNADDEPFLLTQPPNKKVKGQASLSPGQQWFKFRVMLRYGSSCLLCGVNIIELLNGTHIRPKRYRGTDDPRNGLLLCSLHSQAFDAKMFGIEPHTLMIKYRKDGPGKSALKINIDDLHTLEKKPHTEALKWFWERWNTPH
ncbi:HNH endonuclease, partial [Dehalococcoidia bacterium]|nr:HNH endonuclease [Dehalococcoidia bacterium]